MGSGCEAYSLEQSAVQLVQLNQSMKGKRVLCVWAVGGRSGNVCGRGVQRVGGGQGGGVGL